MVGGRPLLVYLSVTDKTPENDASAFTKDATGNINDPEQFMLEDTDYYIYVYDISTAALLKTHAFHTQAMPTGSEIAALAVSTGFGVDSFPGRETTIGIRASESMILPARIGKTLSGILYERGGQVSHTCNLSLTCRSSSDPSELTYTSALKRFSGELSTGSGFTTVDMLVYIRNDKQKTGLWNYRDSILLGTDIYLFTLVSIEG